MDFADLLEQYSSPVPAPQDLPEDVRFSDIPNAHVKGWKLRQDKETTILVLDDSAHSKHEEIQARFNLFSEYYVGQSPDALFADGSKERIREVVLNRRVREPFREAIEIINGEDQFELNHNFIRKEFNRNKNAGKFLRLFENHSSLPWGTPEEYIRPSLKGNIKSQSFKKFSPTKPTKRFSPYPSTQSSPTPQLKSPPSPIEIPSTLVTIDDEELKSFGVAVEELLLHDPYLAYRFDAAVSHESLPSWELLDFAMFREADTDVQLNAKPFSSLNTNDLLQLVKTASDAGNLSAYDAAYFFCALDQQPAQQQPDNDE